MTWSFRATATALVSVVLVACGSSTAALPTPAASLSGPPAAQEVAAECQSIDLRSPTGERIDLTGTWVELASSEREGTLWWVRQQGTCPWATGPWLEFPESPVEGYDLPFFQGVIDESFAINGELVELAPLSGDELIASESAVQPYTELRWVIDFDAAGEPVLTEDRLPGVQGPRCPDPTFSCPAPIVLVRAD